MTIFDPNVVSSIFRLNEYLDAEEKRESLCITAKAQDTAYAEKARVEKPYYNRWQIAWIIVKSPIDVCLALFFKCISNLCAFLGSPYFAKSFYLRALYQLKDIDNLLFHFQYQEHFLCPTFGTVNPSMTDFYCLESIPKASVRDPALSDLVPPQGLVFDHWKGACRGICNWFVHLYSLTLPSFDNDHRLCLLAVSEQFQTGAPYSAALLQTFLYYERNMGQEYLERDFFTFPYSHIDTELHDVLDGTERLPPGTYIVRTEIHAFVFIKADENLGFIFDPSVGLLQVEESMTAELLARIQYYQRHQNHGAHIEFIRVLGLEEQDDLEVLFAF